jgi:hypothetical protein
MIGIVLLSFFVQISLLFCSVKLDYFYKFYRIRHKNHYNQLKYRYMLHLRMNEMLPKTKKILMNDLIYLDINLMRKKQLVTSYSLKNYVNRHF